MGDSHRRVMLVFVFSPFNAQTVLILFGSSSQVVCIMAVLLEDHRVPDLTRTSIAYVTLGATLVT